MSLNVYGMILTDVAANSSAYPSTRAADVPGSGIEKYPTGIHTELRSVNEQRCKQVIGSKGGHTRYMLDRVVTCRWTNVCLCNM